MKFDVDYERQNASQERAQKLQAQLSEVRDPQERCAIIREAALWERHCDEPFLAVTLMIFATLCLDSNRKQRMWFNRYFHLQES